MKTKLTQSVLMLFLVVGLFVMGAGKVEGKNQDGGPWSSGNLVDLLAYHWSWGGSGSLWGWGEGWSVSLANPNVSVTYSAQMRNVDTGEILLDGASIPMGTHLKFEVKPYQDTDISWFGLGYSEDSPYGHWVNNANPPAYGCIADDIVTLGATNGTLYGYNQGIWAEKVYIPLNVNPPTYTINHDNSKLICDSTGVNCEVTGAGPLSSSVSFTDTFGKFYYRYDGGSYINIGCAVDNNPMRTITGWYPLNGFANWLEPTVSSSDFVFTIPAQTITFNLTAVSNNNPPTIPTLSSDAPSKNINTDFIFTAQSTDPDGDTLRYGYDFTGSATTPGLYVPNTATLASGTPQSALYQWPLPGTYTVRVRAEDNQGGVSGWSIPVTVTVNALPLNPIINSFTINGSTGSVNLLRGDMRNIAWTVSNAVSCSASSGDVWSGNKAVPTGNDALPANVTTPHTLDCMNVLGIHTSSTIQVNVSCIPSTGTFGSCACATETKTRTNTSALCISVVESATCDVDEKKACRNFNWTEGAP